MKDKPRQRAWIPPDYTDAHVTALQALARGEASEKEQKRALDWIINTACGTYELSYRSDQDGGDRETAFAEGRRFVGMQVVKLVNMAPAVLQQLRKSNG